MPEQQMGWEETLPARGSYACKKGTVPHLRPGWHQPVGGGTDGLTELIRAIGGVCLG